MPKPQTVIEPLPDYNLVYYRQFRNLTIVNMRSHLKKAKDVSRGMNSLFINYPDHLILQFSSSVSRAPTLDVTSFLQPTKREWLMMSQFYSKLSTTNFSKLWKSSSRYVFIFLEEQGTEFKTLRDGEPSESSTAEYSRSFTLHSPLFSIENSGYLEYIWIDSVTNSDGRSQQALEVARRALVVCLFRTSRFVMRNISDRCSAVQWQHKLCEGGIVQQILFDIKKWHQRWKTRFCNRPSTVPTALK